RRDSISTSDSTERRSRDSSNAAAGEVSVSKRFSSDLRGIRSTPTKRLPAMLVPFASGASTAGNPRENPRAEDDVTLGRVVHGRGLDELDRQRAECRLAGAGGNAARAHETDRRWSLRKERLQLPIRDPGPRHSQE